MLNEEKIFQQDIVAAVEEHNELIREQNQLLSEICTAIKFLR